MLTLISACVFYVDQNYMLYKKYNVVTQVKFKESEDLLFPALTLCLYEAVFSNDLTKQHLRNLSFSDAIRECYFESPLKNCSTNDFEHLQMKNSRRGLTYNCYKFNGGKNATGHKTPLFKSTKFGKYSGLTIVANLTKHGTFIYNIGDNFVRPIFLEFTNYIQPRKNIYIGIKKTVDIQLPEPYNNCKENVNPDMSRLVKKILEQNMTYRKINCYDLCLEEYALGRNLSVMDVFNRNEFHYVDSCFQHCPLECKSNIFEAVKSEQEIDDGSSYGFSRINFHFVDNKFTEVTQAVKITESDLVSNTGGVLGLFLELSFWSVYRLVISVLDMFGA